MYESYVHHIVGDSPAASAAAAGVAAAFARKTQAIIAPSEDVALLLRRRGVRQHLFVLPTGVAMLDGSVERRQLARQRLGIAPQDRVVSFVSRLSREKNLEEVAAALERSSATRILVAGSGPDEDWFKQRLSAQFLGSLSGEALRDVYLAADVFVFASLTETQGMVCLESLAAGTPVVALDAPGVRDVVISGYNGRLGTDLVAGLEEVLRSPASGWRERCLLSAQRFLLARTIPELEAIYQFLRKVRL